MSQQRDPGPSAAPVLQRGYKKTQILGDLGQLFSWNFFLFYDFATIYKVILLFIKHLYIVIIVNVTASSGIVDNFILCQNILVVIIVF